MSYRISCTESMTRTPYSQFLDYQECTVFNSQTFRLIKITSLYCHLAIQTFLLSCSCCNRGGNIPDNQQYKNLNLKLYWKVWKSADMELKLLPYFICEKYPVIMCYSFQTQILWMTSDQLRSNLKKMFSRKRYAIPLIPYNHWNEIS